MGGWGFFFPEGIWRLVQSEGDWAFCCSAHGGDGAPLMSEKGGFLPLPAPVWSALSLKRSTWLLRVQRAEGVPWREGLKVLF